MSTIFEVIRSLDIEFRSPVTEAWYMAAGDLEMFENELKSLVWEIPDLPVRHILDRLIYEKV